MEEGSEGRRAGKALCSWAVRVQGEGAGVGKVSQGFVEGSGGACVCRDLEGSSCLEASLRPEAMLRLVLPHALLHAVGHEVQTQVLASWVGLDPEPCWQESLGLELKLGLVTCHFQHRGGPPCR